MEQKYEISSIVYENEKRKRTAPTRKDLEGGISSRDGQVYKRNESEKCDEFGAHGQLHAGYVLKAHMRAVRV